VSRNRSSDLSQPKFFAILRKAFAHPGCAPKSYRPSAVLVFIPVLVTAIVAVMLSREDSASLAYIAGSLGTLIGADLTNLDKVRGLVALVASIGGRGHL
jgi:hypothetical protein